MLQHQYRIGGRQRHRTARSAFTDDNTDQGNLDLETGFDGAGNCFRLTAGFGINPRTFWSLGLTESDDVIMCVWKCLTFGAVIPVISAQAGLEATGGSEGVGWATTRAVVNSSFAVIVLDFLISTAGFLIFAP